MVNPFQKTNPLIQKLGTYNPSTGTYTSPTGITQSRNIENVPKGTAIVFSGGYSSSDTSRGSTVSSGGTAPLPTTAYNEELRKEIERERIATETQNKLINAQKIQDERQRNLEMAKIRLDASNERARLNTQSGWGQLTELSTGINKRIKSGEYIVKDNQILIPVKQEAKIIQPEAKSTGILYMKSTGSFRPEGSNKDIPTFQLTYKQGVYERKATKQEYEYYQSQPNESNVLIASKPTKSLQSIKLDDTVMGIYERLNLNLYQSITKPIDVGITKATGYSPEALLSKGVEKGILLNPAFTKIPQVTEFAKGLYIETYKDIRDQPLKQVIIYGSGYAIGGGISAVNLGAKSLASTLPRTAKTIQFGTKALGYGVGSLYVTGTVVNVVTAPTYYEKGSVIGMASKDLFLFGKGATKGSKIVNYYFEPLKIREPLRKVMTPQAGEVSITVVKGNRDYNLAQYKITGEYSPPIKEYTTNRFKQFFDIKPRASKIKLIPARTFEINTLSPVLQNKPFTVYETRAGGKYKSNVVRFINIKGGSQDFNPRIDLNSLTKTEQYALTKMIESKTGRVASVKVASKFFAEGSDFSSGFIKSTKEFKVNIKSGRLDILTKNRINLSQAITRTKPLFETEKVDVFTSETFFKDVSKPYARASGKTPSLNTILVRIKEPLILDMGESNMIIPAQITKTPLSKTFKSAQLTQSKLTMNELIKSIPKIKPVYATQKPVYKTRGISQSIYSGLGLYERTESVSYTSPKNLYLTSQPAKEITSLINTPSIKTITLTKEINKYKEEPRLKETNILKEVYKLKEEAKLKEQPKLKEVLKLKQELKLKQALKLKQMPKQKLTPSISFQPTKTKEPPKTPPFRFNQRIKFNNQKGLFSVSVRRFGKFKPIGIFSSYRQAFNIGKFKVGTTLGATFKVSGKGNAGIPLGFYTKNTKQGKLFIEQPKFRLSTRTERLEIQSYKKRKGGVF